MKNLILMGLVAGTLISGVAQAQTAWTDKISLGGDLRFRYRHDHTPGVQSADYNQIRARLTASAKVNENMTANFRLATHNHNYSGVSSNDTLGDQSGGSGTTGEKSAFDLDLAYGDWRVMPGLVLSVGKAPNPFWQAGKNEMLWDADLAFDGLTAKWAADMDTLKPFANLSYNWIQENNVGATAAFPGTDNIMQVGAQAGASMAMGDAMKATAAVGYHNITGAKYVTGYGIELLNVGAELGLNAGNMPVAVYGDYVTNMGDQANDNEKVGYIAGVKAGSLAAVGGWEAWYNFREVGAQANVVGLGDSDFGPRDNDISGHQIGGAYMAWDNTTVGLNYTNARIGTDSHSERYFADLVWKF